MKVRASTSYIRPIHPSTPTLSSLLCYQAIQHVGGWESDETVEEAATRETVEEAGVRGDLMNLLGCYNFKSKTHQDEYCPEGLCRAAMFALLVKEELESWPEQSTRTRFWLTVPEAVKCCRHAWMRDALVDGFLRWHGEKFAERANSH